VFAQVCPASAWKIVMQLRWSAQVECCRWCGRRIRIYRIFLDEFLAFGIERRCHGSRFGVLFLGSILDGRVPERLVLSFRSFVLKNGESFLHISWHKKMQFVIVIIPVHVDTNVSGARPISGDFIMFLENLE
jgi:hypothetical protein